MHGQDLYIRVTDPSGTHKPVISQHRVWDADRFLASQQRNYAEARDPAERRIVTVASRTDYINQRSKA